LVRMQNMKVTQYDTEKQRLLRKLKHNNKIKTVSSTKTTNEATIVCAIVSTLHNTSNMYRDAGEPLEAIRVLIEAQSLVEHSIIGPFEQQQQTMMGTRSTDADDNNNDDDDTTTSHNYFHYYQLLARLFTAIGHIYYSNASGSNDYDNDGGESESELESESESESESLHKSKIYYENALQVYENLLMKCTTSTSCSLSLSQSRCSTTTTTATTSTERNHHNEEQQQHQYQQQYQQHRELIQHEIHLLQQDIKVLNRCCQEEGSRRRRRHCGRKRVVVVHTNKRGRGKQQQQQQQQQTKQLPSFFNFIRNLRSA